MIPNSIFEMAVSKLMGTPLSDIAELASHSHGRAQVAKFFEPAIQAIIKAIEGQFKKATKAVKVRSIIYRRALTEHYVHIGHRHGRRVFYLGLSLFKAGGSFQDEKYYYPEAGRISVSRHGGFYDGLLTSPALETRQSQRVLLRSHWIILCLVEWLNTHMESNVALLTIHNLWTTVHASTPLSRRSMESLYCRNPLGQY